MKIRKATKKDLGVIVDFAGKLLLEHEKEFSDFPKLSKNFHQAVRRYHRNFIKRPKTVGFLAIENNKAIGLILGEEKKDYPVFEKNERPIGHVGNFYVEPQFRNMGIGKKLFSELKKWFRKRGLEKIEISLTSSNRIVKGLYKELGFKPYEEKWRMFLK